MKNESLKFGIIIQARMNSSRLPGKVMMDIVGAPMLRRQIERLVGGLRDIPVVVATSLESTDDGIADLCLDIGCDCYRGALNDVMGRFILCAKQFDFSHIVRVGGDDPLIDPFCCMSLIDQFLNDSADFLYASHRDGWPYGCAAELFSVDALVKAYRATNEAKYLEHIIPYFFDNLNDFSIHKVVAPVGLRRPDLCFSVDYQEDLNLVREVYSELLNENTLFSMKEVIELMDAKPDLKLLNAHLHDGFDR
jgi:spore coat polysaccharide biosynthesis protein SpsF